MVNYIMKLTCEIDTLAKKNTFRDQLLTSLNNGISTGTIVSYSLDINATIVPSEDSEAYKSP